VTVEQLKAELDAIKDPLMAKSKEAMTRVFALYKTLTGKEPRGSGCYGCALDAYYELKTIASRGYGWDNSLNLPSEFTNQFKTNTMTGSLKKYKLIRSFRVFGSPDLYTEHNLNDALADKLLKTNPALSKHFEVIEKPKAEAKVEEVTESDEQQEQTSSIEEVVAKPRRKITKK
jgi:hypothetical protein